MRQLREHAGSYVMAVGVLHCAFGLGWFGLSVGLEWVGSMTPLFSLAESVELAATGLFNGLGGLDGPVLQRFALFWFVAAGAATVAVGWLMQRLQRAEDALPRGLGVAFLALAAVGIGTMPVSGFWLFLPVGVALASPASNEVF